MANIKISELPAAAAASGTQEFETNDGGTSKKVTGSQLKSFVKDGLTVSDVTDLTATATELNTLDGITASTAELNFVGGVTSAIQTQLNGKAAASAGVPSGAIAHFAMNTAPTGWLKANGAAVSRTTYATLFAAIGTTFGVGDGSTTFNLPDLRGRFTRNWANDGSIDSGRAFGSTQDDAFQGHWHGIQGVYQIGRDGGGGTGSGNLRDDGSPAAPYPYATYMVGDGVNGTPRTATETRPTNIALLACIKY